MHFQVSNFSFLDSKLTTMKIYRITLTSSSAGSINMSDYSRLGSRGCYWRHTDWRLRSSNSEWGRQSRSCRLARVCGRGGSILRAGVHCPEVRERGHRQQLHSCRDHYCKSLCALRAILDVPYFCGFPHIVIFFPRKSLFCIKYYGVEESLLSFRDMLSLKQKH